MNLPSPASIFPPPFQMTPFLRPLLKRVFSLREQKDVEMVKPFLEHLEDLRWTLMKMAFTLAVAMIGSFAYRFSLMHLVQLPLHSIPDQSAYLLRGLSPTDSVNTSLSLAFYAGLILSFPFQLYFVAGFVLPALNETEKSYLIPAIFGSFALFLGGVLSCFYLVLPATLRWLWSDQKKMGFDPTWTVGTYFSFSTQFVLIFGLSFELPVVVIILVKMGLLQASTLRSTRAYAFVLILALAAFIAPSPDPFTMGVVAGPMLLLYEACIWIAWYMERKSKLQASRLKQG